MESAQDGARGIAATGGTSLSDNSRKISIPNNAIPTMLAFMLCSRWWPRCALRYSYIAVVLHFAFHET
jgi:hypothetical protein